MESHEQETIFFSLKTEWGGEAWEGQRRGKHFLF